MKINELILEHPVDEGLGQAIGKAWGGAMKGVGAVGGGLAGSWDAMKQGYNAGKAAVSGRVNPDDSDPTLAGAQPGAAGAAGAQPGAAGAAGAQPGAAGAQPGAAAAMKAADIVKDLDDVWSKATADQGSETSSAQVQQKIIAMAKNAGLAGQTIKENKVGFQSRFLNMEI